MTRRDARAPLMLSSLLASEVVDEDGRRLGHVHDVRIVRESGGGGPGQAPRYRVEGLIVGRRGLHARLGLARSRRSEPLRPSEPLLWEDVVALEERRIVVRRCEQISAGAAAGARR